MQPLQALQILEIFLPPVNLEIIKKAYRKLSSKYHPDKNPNGLERMKEINVAYGELKDLPQSHLEGLLYERPQQQRTRPFTYTESSSYKDFLKAKMKEYENSSAQYAEELKSHFKTKIDDFKEEMASIIEYFSSRGCSVSQYGNTLIIAGKTYEYRDELKSFKFKWNPEAKTWGRLFV